MKSTRCSNCGVTLNLPVDFDGGGIQCPRCGKRFKAKPLRNSPSESNKPKSTKAKSKPDLAVADELFGDSILDEVQHVSEPTVSARPQPSKAANVSGAADGDSSTQKNAGPASEPVSENSPSVSPPSPTNKVDFNFKKFWTPAIIKGSWWCVVVLSIAWFLFLTIFYVGAWFSGESPTQSASNMLSGQGLNLQEVLSGQGDVDSLNNMLDKLDGSQSGNGNAVQLSTFQRVSRFLFKALSFVTLLASIVLSVLWCRVFFETIIAVFEIAARLKSIDEKT